MNNYDDLMHVYAMIYNLQKFWIEHPYLRLGQMISNALTFANTSGDNNNLFYIRDEELMQYIKQSHGEKNKET